MLMQSSQYDCGAVALHNALASLGHYRSLDELRAICKSSAQDGTSPLKLKRGIDKIKDSCGLVSWEIRTGKKDVAVGLLHLALANGRPGLLLVDNGAHWVAWVGQLGMRILVADSASAELVVSVDPEAFFTRWHCEGRDSYYALVL